MHTHDYLILTAAVERYSELLTIAEQERQLRAIARRTPISMTVWSWMRPWFRYRAPVFSPLTKG